MENELDIQLQERYKALPQKLQDFIASDDAKNIISETLNGQPLQQKQIDIFGRELMFVLLGLETVSSFTDNIKLHMEISISRAEELSRNIKQKVFLPFQDALILDEPVEEPSENSIPQEAQSVPHKPEQPYMASENENRIEHPPIKTPVQNDSYTEKPQDTQNIPPAPQKESVDIFKKRLSESVHTPVEQKIIADKKQERPAPTSHEELAGDQYRETPT